MLQQTAPEKRQHRLSIFDNLSANSLVKRERKKELAYLEEDYAAAVKIAANLSSHSKWIPYPFLIDRLKKIADELRGQAELIRAKIAEMGGSVPQVIVSARDEVDFRQNVKRLVADMEEHAARSEALVHQKNNVTDAGVVKLLGILASQMQKENQELLDVVMRVS